MFKYILYYLKNFLILIRINQPTGIMLLMFPAIWSILIVLKEEIDIYLLLLFAYGSFIMRSGGCIINDIIDKKIDRNIERTKSRPLASEKLENSDAIILLIIFLVSHSKFFYSNLKHQLTIFALRSTFFEKPTISN